MENKEIKITIKVPKNPHKGLSEWDSMCKTLGIEKKVKWEQVLEETRLEYPKNDCFKCEHCKVCDVLLTCLEGKELHMNEHFFVCGVPAINGKHNVIPFESEGGEEECEDFSPRE